MAYADVLVEVKDNVAWLTINRPDKGNTFRRQTVLELIQALNEARHDMQVRVVVITGAGDRFFCLGGEKEPSDGMLHYHNVPPVVDLYTLIDMMPVPVIAMVNGFAVGGGNVLANMCDLTVASEQASFRQVGPMMGSYDAGFGTWYLEDAVGRKRAREIWYLNRKYSATEAQALGLVNEVVPHAELRARTAALCEELKQRGPQALAALKAAFHARHNGVTGMSRMSIDHLVANYYHTEEAKEMGRAFNAKDTPNPEKFYR
ncbi:MAG: enoyl-CoA hydratase-related protein [candidate division NC10 bacterium]